MNTTIKTKKNQLLNQAEHLNYQDYYHPEVTNHFERNAFRSGFHAAINAFASVIENVMWQPSVPTSEETKELTPDQFDLIKERYVYYPDDNPEHNLYSFDGIDWFKVIVRETPE